MLTLATLKKYDKLKMYEVYDNWPSIASDAYNSSNEDFNFSNINNIVFAGMGGSGTLGDVLFSILSKTKIHSRVVKGYHLPKTVDENTLVIASSVSGNTIETLSILKSAYTQHCKIMAFSSGGKIKKYCERNKIPHKQIVLVHSPRASFASYLYSILGALRNTLPVREQDVNESIRLLKKLESKICSQNLSNTNLSLELGRWIRGIPLIYYPLGLQSAAVRFKNSLQENAKTHSMAEDVIEACHNGIMSWERKSCVQPILLRGYDDYYKTKQRWKIIKEYFADKNIEYKEIVSVKGSILSKLMSMIYLLDYSTIYKAILARTDPSPIVSIDYIKSRL